MMTTSHTPLVCYNDDDDDDIMLTLSSTRTGSMPKNGLMGNPGLGVESSGDGRGVIMIPPVSAQ